MRINYEMRKIYPSMSLWNPIRKPDTLPGPVILNLALMATYFPRPWLLWSVNTKVLAGCAPAYSRDFATCIFLPLRLSGLKPSHTEVAHRCWLRFQLNTDTRVLVFGNGVGAIYPLIFVWNDTLVNTPPNTRCATTCNSASLQVST